MGECPSIQEGKEFHFHPMNIELYPYFINNVNENSTLVIRNQDWNLRLSKNHRYHQPDFPKKIYSAWTFED